ncbi:ankyrin repeat domain-containing protein [Marinobacter sp. DUT-3]|uniref:ankyrin repeat domain-containing protein n=1 Tax=Marinobacter sp. DUT-3 TaxID=3412036 RepID=UPI003D17F875
MIKRYIKTAACLCLTLTMMWLSGCTTPNMKLQNAFIGEQDIGLARQALAEGADPNMVLYDGVRPLHKAFIADKEAFIRGTDNDGFNKDLFELLTSYNANLSISLVEKGDLPAIFFAKTLESVEALVAAGADVKQRTSQGETVLHHSASMTPAAVERLMELGADPHLKDKRGVSAIDVVIFVRDSSKERLGQLIEKNSVTFAQSQRRRAIRLERILALMESRDFDETLIAREYPPIDDNRLELASKNIIPDNSGKFLSPYTSDGVTAEWVNQAINAGIGAQIGSTTGAATAGSIARELGESFAVVAVVSMAGSAIGEAIGRSAAIETSGGWEHIRATSDMSFNSLADMARYLRLKHGNDENFDEVFTATKQVYPDLAN